MEKTVIVAAANNLSSAACGHNIAFELTPSGKGAGNSSSKSSVSKNISKSLWTCCVESVCEYCRIVFDLFPDQNQVCVAAVDEAKCQPVNSWRDEDQEMGKVLSGFQKFGPPHFEPPQTPMRGQSYNPITPCIQGMQYAVRCLAQLTATQYATMTSHNRKPLVNQGRIVFLCSLKSTSDVKELEKVIVSMVRSENTDIKQKQDPARLQIQHCQLVLINTYSPQGHPPEIKDSPLTQLSSQVSSVVYSFPGKLLLEKCVHLTKMHFDLKSTLVTGIPMKEEQTGGSSSNYDVELLHPSEAHRDILRAGYGLGPNVTSKRDSKEASYKDVVMLKWSTPRTTSLDLQFCTSAYRVTPSDVTSRPTICLINFVLSGKPVLLEQPKKGPNKIVSHVLNSYQGAVFLHSIPSARNYIDEPPSISEGWGGRVTDYRISDFSEVVRSSLLVPNPVDRTRIPTVYPIEKSTNKLEYTTRHWPIVYNDTLVYTLKQELDPLPDLLMKESLTESELEEAKTIILHLASKEANNEALSVPSSGGRNKGVKRDEQYRSLWTELENIAHLYASNSDRHRQLLEFIVHTSSHCPSMQTARKTSMSNSNNSMKKESLSASSTVSDGSRTDLAWQELDRYQQMSTREKTDFNMADTNNDHRRHLSQHTADPSEKEANGGVGGKPLPIPAKPVASLLSIWTGRLHRKATSSHVEFAGRVGYGERADLYSKLKTSSIVPPIDQDT